MEFDKRKAATMALITSMLLAFAVFGLNVNVASASSTTTVYIDPPSVTVSVCSNFTVDVKVGEVTDLYCWQFELTFNPNLTTCLNVTEGPFLKNQGPTNWIPPVIDNVAGSVMAACTLMTPPGASGSGTLAYAELHCKGPGSCALHFGPLDTFLLNSSLYDIPCQEIDGSVTQRAPPVGGIWVPVSKFGLLAPYIGLASTILVATVATAIYVKHVKRGKKKQ